MTALSQRTPVGALAAPDRSGAQIYLVSCRGRTLGADCLDAKCSTPPAEDGLLHKLQMVVSCLCHQTHRYCRAYKCSRVRLAPIAEVGTFEYDNRIGRQIACMPPLGRVDVVSAATWTVSDLGACSYVLADVKKYRPVVDHMMQ